MLSPEWCLTMPWRRVDSWRLLTLRVCLTRCHESVHFGRSVPFLQPSCSTHMCDMAGGPTCLWGIPWWRRPAGLTKGTPSARFSSRNHPSSILVACY